MVKRLMAVAALVGAAGFANADGVSLGYSPVPLQREYVQQNLQTPAQTQQESTFGAGTVQVLYTVEKKLRDKVNLTFTSGVGIPMGSAKFDNKNEVTNAPAVVSKNTTNEGDSEEVEAFTVPALVGAKYIMPMGDNALTIGVSVGAMLIGVRTTMTNVTYTGPVAAETKSNTTVTYTADVAPAFAGFATIGYNIKMGEGESIGISVPLGLISEVRRDTESTNEGTVPAGALKTTDNGWKAGGFAYGIQIAYNKSY